MCEGYLVREGGMDGACSAYTGEMRTHTKLYSENMKERDDLGVLSIGGRLILKLTVKK